MIFDTDDTLLYTYLQKQDRLENLVRTDKPVERGEMMTSNHDLKEWLESRFQKIEHRIDGLEKSLSEEKKSKIRIAWYRTLLGMVDMGGQVGTEQLAGHLRISRSVISEYLNRMEEEGLVRRDFNEDSAQKSRYVWRIDWDSLPPEIASRLKKK